MLPVVFCFRWVLWQERENLEKEERLRVLLHGIAVDRESNASVRTLFVLVGECQARIRTMQLVLPPPLTSWSFYESGWMSRYIRCRTIYFFGV